MINTFQFSMGGGYVLAIEDSLVQAKKLEHFFKQHNIQYRIQVSAEDAIRAMEIEKPALVISDIVMPGMDGYELCRYIKSNKELSHIPVILLTSLQDPHDIIRGLQAGADNFITKPYEDNYLISRIQYLLINKDIRRSGNSEMLMELVFRGEKYQINSDKRQILDLLLSVYEAAIQRNEELVAVKSSLEKANQDLIQANQDLDAFTHTVSHDLRSPLSVIHGFTHILLDNENSTLSEEEKSYLEVIKESTLSMSQLITDLMNFSQSGKIEIKQEKIDMSGLGQEVIETILSRTDRKDIKFEIMPGMEGIADNGLIRIVLDNLIGNACKYAGKSEHPLVIFGLKDYFGQKVFFIKDNGVGFNMANAGKLFMPFQRLHSAAEFSGTGVGLSTVKRIIERHGGQVWAESEEGNGATFFFTLGEQK